MPVVRLPNNWVPRDCQKKAWTALERGIKRVLLVWHRRAGKDDVCLHFAATQVMQRIGNYWHMLPEYEQARKSVWMAVNPHTGKRRIDEAFPEAIRKRTDSQQMLIEFISGSTWQLVGSDNYNSLVGSPPIGITLSEWALANPSAWAYLAPILRENGGWAAFISTPRGKNHMHKMYEGFKNDPNWFVQLMSVVESGALTPTQLEEARQEYVVTYGEDHGNSLFEQEYMCSFEAALIGAYYGKEFRDVEARGGVGIFPHDPQYPVNTAWDLGFSDDTGIWFYQVIGGQVRVLEYYGTHGKDMRHYIEQIYGKKIINDEWQIRPNVKVLYGDDIDGLAHRRAYKYGLFWLPHDARAKTLASGGRSIQETAWIAFGTGNVRIVSGLSLQDGIQAVRAMLPRTCFDREKSGVGVELAKMYQREWDDDKKIFREKPKHDFTSHAADSLRMLAIAYKEEHASKGDEPTKWPQDRTIAQMIARQTRRRREGE